MQKQLETNIFSHYLHNEDIFGDKKYLNSNFIPHKIPHRDKEIQQIGDILAPVLKGYNPSNIFIYGTCGTGKTICAKFIINQLQDIVKGNGCNLKVIYINCKMKKVADTEYRLFAQLLKELGEVVPDTGLPTNTLYRRFFDKTERMKATVIIILDEVDALVKKIGDEFLYNLIRVNQELKKSYITVVGITNDLLLMDNIELRVRSSLSGEEIIFKPYDAAQLKDILSDRAKYGFRQNTVSDAVISKCAAIAAQEHGDARRALDLLRVAGELAERMNERYITERHVDMAQQKIDLDRITETIKSQPTQSQALLYSIIKLHEKMASVKNWKDKRLLTGEVFSMYQTTCQNAGLKPLTQRRISDLIVELEMLGIINTRIVSKGRYGRTRDIVLTVNADVLEKIRTYLSGRLDN